MDPSPFDEMREWVTFIHIMGQHGDMRHPAPESVTERLLDLTEMEDASMHKTLALVTPWSAGRLRLSCPSGRGQNPDRRRHEGGGAGARAGVREGDRAQGGRRQRHRGRAGEAHRGRRGVRSRDHHAGRDQRSRRKGKVVGDSATNVARVGVGVVVKEGAAVPDVGSVEAFKNGTATPRRSVAYIDPAIGRIERHLSHRPVRQARHRGRHQAEGEAEAGRLRRRPDRERRGRARPAPDQRNPAREGRQAGRPAAGRNPELHDLCGGGRRGGQAAGRARAR